MSFFAPASTKLFVRATSSLFAAAAFIVAPQSAATAPTWTAASSGLPLGAATAIHAKNGQLFAGTNGAGLYYSADQGAIWQHTTNSVSLNAFYGFISDIETFQGNLFVGLRGGGVYKSTDDGTTFTAVNSGMTQRTVYDLLPVGSQLYASTVTSGVYVSNDGGNTWSSYGSATIGEPICYQMTYDGTWLYVGTNSHGAYRSVPGSGTWSAASNGQPYFGSFYQQVFGMGFDGASIHSGLDDEGDYWSDDHGANWHFGAQSIGTLDVMTYCKTSTAFFAGTKYGGVHRLNAANAGTSWTSVNIGLANGADSVNALTFDGTYLYAAADSGIYRTANDGATWTAVRTGFDAYENITSSIGFGGYTYVGLESSGVYRTLDGTSWQARNSGVTGNINGFGALGSKLFVGGHTGEIYVTSDGGANYTQVKSSTNANIAYCSSFAFYDSAHMYANSYGYGVFTSGDGGNTWSLLSTTGLLNLNVNVLAILTVGGTPKLLAGTDNGMYIYDVLSGGTWTTLSTSGMSNVFVQSFRQDGTSYYAGTRQGIYSSSGALGPWTLVGGGMPAVWTNNIFRDSSTLYAGTLAGAYYSTDNGATWHSLLTGLQNRGLTSMSVNGSTIFATTNGSGAWKIPTINSAPVTISHFETQ